jgi:hypothetical protein
MVFFLIKNRKNGGFNKTRSRDLLSRVPSEGPVARLTFVMHRNKERL